MEEVITEDYITSLIIFIMDSSGDKYMQEIGDLKNRKIVIGRLCEASLGSAFLGYSCKDIDKTIHDPKGNTKGICIKCFKRIKSLHPKVEGKTIIGYCLCGNYSQYKEPNFCFLHQLNEAEKFNLSIARKLFDSYFELLAIMIINVYKVNEEIQTINSQIMLLYNLCKESELKKHFISGFLLKNYPIMTTHYCTRETDADISSENAIETVVSNNESILIDNNVVYYVKDLKHKCQCSFIRILSHYMNSNDYTQIQLASLFTKEKYTLCYLSLLDSSFFIKIIEDEEILESLFEEIESYMKYYFKEENISSTNCETMFNIFNHIINDFELLSKKSIDILSNNNTVMIIIINCLSYIQYRMPFSSDSDKNMQNNIELCQILFSIEKKLLDIFCILTNIFNYKNKEKTDQVIREIIQRIKEKKYIAQLKQGENSVHIPVNRALAIFLAKNIVLHEKYQKEEDYVYEGSNDDEDDYDDDDGPYDGNTIDNYSDIVMELLINQSFTYYTDSFDQMITDIIVDTLQCIGFINSIPFTDNDNNCFTYYCKQYYSYEIFYQSDYTLIKILLAQNKDGSIINLNTLMKHMNTNGLYSSILPVLEGKRAEIVNNTTTSQSFYAENLRTLSCILLNDYFVMNLILYSTLFIPDLYCNEKIKDRYKRNFKQIMIHKITIILLKNDTISESEIMGKFPKSFHEKDIEEILSKVAVITKSSIGENKKDYQINPVYLGTIDINTIISYNYYNIAKNILKTGCINSNSNDNGNGAKSATLFNYNHSFFYKTRSWESLYNLNRDMNINFLYKTNNVKSCIEMLKAFLYESDLSNVSIEFISQNIKMIYIFYCNREIYPLGNNPYQVSLKEINLLMKHPSRHELTHEDFNLFYKKQLKRIDKKLKGNDYAQEPKLSCCECGELLKSSSDYGQPGLIISDSFLYHIHLQTIHFAYKAKKNLGEKINLRQLMCDYDMSRSEMKRSLRITTCKDYIHFSCFNKMMSYTNSNSSMNSNCISENTTNPYNNIIMLCPSPLCKMMFNCYVPLFYFDDEEVLLNYSEQIQGFTFDEFFNYSKHHHKASHGSMNITNAIDSNINGSTKSTRNSNNNNNSNGSLTDDNINGVQYFIHKIIALDSLRYNESPSNNCNGNSKKYEGKWIYRSLLNFFMNLIEMIHRYRYPKDIAMLQKFIISIKCLFKAKMLYEDTFLDKFKQKLEWLSNEDCDLLENNKIEAKYYELIFLMLTLFDFSEYQHWKYILMNYLPYLYIQFFLWSHYINTFSMKYDELANLLNIKELSLYLNENQNNLWSFLHNYLDKTSLIISVFNYEYTPMTFREFIDRNHFICKKNWDVDTLLLNKTKPHFWHIPTKDIQSILNAYSMRKLNYMHLNNITEDIINPALILLNLRRKYEGIHLPNKRADLMKKNSILINNITAAHCYSIICLICGQKICNTKDCCCNYGKDNNLYEHIYHNLICGKGNGIYLNINNGNVLFALMNIFQESKVRLYNYERKNKKEMWLSLVDYERIIEEYASLGYVDYFK